MISTDKVSKYFGRLKALDEVSIRLEEGKSYALIGPNSSGKTTLIKSVLGMVIPNSGEIRVNDINIRNQWDYRQYIGYMPQIGRYPDNMKIGQLVDMMKNIRKGAPQLDEELIETFRLQDIFDKRMHTLSGGTRQKVSAALAFLFNPGILILDEPTAGLDPVAVELLKSKILKEKENGKLIIITSHVLSDLDELSTDLIYLFEGKVRYADKIEELKSITGEQRLGRAIAKLISSSSFHPEAQLI